MAVSRFLSSSTASVADIFATSATATSVIRETVNVQGETSRKLFDIAKSLASLEAKLSEPADKALLRDAIKDIVDNGERLVGAMETMVKNIK